MAQGKWDFGLHHDMPCTVGAARVLIVRLPPVQSLLDPALRDPFRDPEHIHRLRVATRRAGAALRGFREVLPKKARQHVQQSLRAFRQAAGMARDWDVFLLNFPEIAAKKKSSDELTFMAGYAFGQRGAAQYWLAKTVTEHRIEYEKAESELLTSLESLPTERNIPRLDTYAREQLTGLFTEFQQILDSRPTSPEALHALRIAAKRLRYSLEIFGELYTSPLREEFYPRIEEIQGILGEIQDGYVAIERLREMGRWLQSADAGRSKKLQPFLLKIMTQQREKITTQRRLFAAWKVQWRRYLRSRNLDGLLELHRETD